MMARWTLGYPIVLATLIAFPAWSQTGNSGNQSTDQNQEQKHKPGAARDIGGGAGSAGVGAAKGAGDAAKGAAKGAGDLVTLHPVDAAAQSAKARPVSARTLP